jgi:hypothetical protein
MRMEVVEGEERPKRRTFGIGVGSGSGGKVGSGGKRRKVLV